MTNDKTTIATQEKVEEIPIDLIKVPGKNPRGAMDDDHVIELSGNIARNGLLQSIGVKKLEDNSYELIWGFHRLAAVIRLGRKKILATIRQSNGNPTTVLSLCENLIRKQMTLQEEIEAVGRLTREEHLSPSMICDLLNRSRAWVDRRLAAPGLPEPVRLALFDGLITLAHSEYIGRMQNEGMRNQILNQVIYGKLTSSQTKDLVEMYEKAPSMEEAIQAGLQTSSQIQTTPQILRPCTLCGTMRDPAGLVFVPVCRVGCPQEQTTKKEYTNNEKTN